MYSKTLVAAAALVAGSALAADLTINTPASLIECQPAAISWTGGTPNYILAVIPGGQVSAAALETLDDAETGTSFTWTVNLAHDTSITLKLTDSTGAIAYSSPLTIQAGSDASCLNATATSAAGSASSAASGASSSAAAGATTSTSTTAASSVAAGSTTTVQSTTHVTSAATGSSSGTTTATSTSAAATTTTSEAAAFPTSKLELPALGLAVLGGMAMLF